MLPTTAADVKAMRLGVLLCTVLAESWHYMIAWPPSILSFSILIQCGMLGLCIAVQSLNRGFRRQIFPLATKQALHESLSIHALMRAVIFSWGLEGWSNEDMIARPGRLAQGHRGAN